MSEQKKKYWSVLRLAFEVRKAQNQYFHTRDELKRRALLKKSKALEQKLDTILTDIFRQFPEEAPKDNTPQQQNLLDSTETWLAL